MILHLYSVSENGGMEGKYCDLLSCDWKFFLLLIASLHDSIHVQDWSNASIYFKLVGFKRFPKYGNRFVRRITFFVFRIMVHVIWKTMMPCWKYIYICLCESIIILIYSVNR